MTKRKKKFTPLFGMLFVVIVTLLSPILVWLFFASKKNYDNIFEGIFWKYRHPKKSYEIGVA